MKNKILFSVLIAFNLLSLAYLLTPLPEIKDLSNSVKSDEPGDTVQIPNVSGYFTNQSRTQVINFYKANFNGLFRIELNHPPEKAKSIIKDTIQSYYFEEFYLPFKESVYVNGYEWENDVFTKPEKRTANRIIYQGKEYKSKVTIRVFSTTIPERLLAFFTTEIAIILLILIYKQYLPARTKK
jgi:hypothetical protein